MHYPTRHEHIAHLNAVFHDPRVSPCGLVYPGQCGLWHRISVFNHQLRTNRKRRHLYLAGGLVFLAFLFDVLDGRIARWRRTHSAMGRDLIRSPM